jgi:transcriptional regulator with XRE-family HTH domain
MNYFASNLLFCRKMFNVSQTQLSSVIGKGQSTIAGWENGVSEPNVEALMKISDFFAIPIDHMIRTNLPELGIPAFKKLVKDEEKLHLLEERIANPKHTKRKKPPIPYPFNNAISIVGEPGPDVSRASAMKVLKVIDGKLDQLLNITKKKAPKKSGK